MEKSRKKGGVFPWRKDADEISQSEHGQRQRRTDRLTLADFEHHEERDEYLCSHREVFRLAAKKTVTDAVTYRRYINDRDGCKDYELKGKCLKGKKTQRRYLMVPGGSIPGNLSKAIATKIDSEKGRSIYHHRIAIAEPAFANIHTLKAVNQVPLGGKINANTQWLLYCMVRNIGKILNDKFKYAVTEEGARKK